MVVEPTNRPKRLGLAQQARDKPERPGDDPILGMLVRLEQAMNGSILLLGHGGQRTKNFTSSIQEPLIFPSQHW